MSFAQRAWKSIVRRPLKSLLLFLIMFILGVVVSRSFAIQQGTLLVEDQIKRQMGAAATIVIDFSAPDNNNNTPLEPLTDQMIEALGQSAYVRAFDYQNNYNIGSDHLVKWLTDDQKEEIELARKNSWDELLDQELRRSMLILKGVQYAPIAAIDSGQLDLVLGRTFLPEEIERGDAVTVISEEIAKLNQLNIGDSVVVSDYIGHYHLPFDDPNRDVGQIDQPLKIIVTFQIGDHLKSVNPNDSQKRDSQIINTWYVPNKIIPEIFVKSFDLAMAQSETTPAVKTLDDYPKYPVYYLNSPDDIPAFQQEAEQILPSDRVLFFNTEVLDKIKGSLYSTKRLAGLVTLIGVGGSVLALSLIILLFLHDRRQELGIYRSLGESKQSIIRQIVSEVLLIALIALPLSLFAGFVMADSLSGSILQSQIVEQVPSDDPKPEKIQAPQIFHFDEFAFNQTEESMIEQYETTFSSSYVIWFLLGGLLTILVSTILPSLYILRLNPKKILM